MGRKLWNWMPAAPIWIKACHDSGDSGPYGQMQLIRKSMNNHRYNGWQRQLKGTDRMAYSMSALYWASVHTWPLTRDYIGQQVMWEALSPSSVVRTRLGNDPASPGVCFGLALTRERPGHRATLAESCLWTDLLKACRLPSEGSLIARMSLVPVSSQPLTNVEKCVRGCDV